MGQIKHQEISSAFLLVDSAFKKKLINNAVLPSNIPKRHYIAIENFRHASNSLKLLEYGTKSTWKY